MSSSCQIAQPATPAARCLELTPNASGKSLSILDMFKLADDDQWPGYIAAWKNYRMQPLERLLVVNLADTRTLDRFVALLVWASRAGVYTMKVRDQLEVREELLQLHLLLATRRLLSADLGLTASKQTEMLKKLWSLQFSSLMPNPSTCTWCRCGFGGAACCCAHR